MKQRVLCFSLLLCTFGVIYGDTVLKLYRPYGDVVEQAPLVAKRNAHCQCFAQSQLILREDAWRCQSEGKVYDPCFVKMVGKQTEVLCPQSPWLGDSLRITVDAPLLSDSHQALDMSRAYPWAIELANGEHCMAIESKEQFDSMPIRYQCGTNAVLVGHLQRCKPTWSMLEKTQRGVETVELKKAWF